MIVSYGLVGNLAEVLKQCAFRFVVLDESHYIKSEKARPCPSGLPDAFWVALALPWSLFLSDA